MSPFSSKPLPNFLSQLTPQRVLSILRQPSAIALLASIGVHGVLALTLPLLPMKSEEPKKPREAKVVALTPAERSRLPSGSGSGSGLKSANPLTLDLPPSFQIPPPSPLYTYPLTPPIETYPIEQTRPDPVPENPIPSSPETKPSVKPSTGNTGNTGNQGNSTGNGGSGNGGSASGLLVCPTPPDSSPACKTALLAAKYAPTNPKRSTQTQTERNAEAFTEYGNNWMAFNNSALDLAKSKAVQFEENKDVSPLPIPFPTEACAVIKEETKAQVGAIIDSDGKVYGKPVLLGSSGYKTLDEMALTAVAEVLKKSGKKGKIRIAEYAIKFTRETDCPTDSPPA